MTQLEEPRRLSHSILWELQWKAYQQFGVNAWSEKGVPFYITSNPLTASKYAQMIFGYVQDLIANEQLDWEQPVYILDLGAGTGRFGYLFLNEFERCLQGLKRVPKFCYVMTDIVQQNLDFCRQHSLLQKYIQGGQLDFAYYAHYFHDEKLKLQILGKELDVINPLILIANYFFDTIPQDQFRVKDGKLQEGRIVLSSENPDSNDPAVINHLQYRFEYYPIESGLYYASFPQANALLQTYRQLFENSSFLFPIGALESIRYFSKISPQQFWLAGDQGVTTEEQVRRWGEPKIALHGSFSIAVSYHALAEYFQLCGGKAWLTNTPGAVFVVMAAISENPKDYPATALGFSTHFLAFDPANYWSLVSESEKHTQTLTEMLMLIKLGKWDPANMYLFFKQIRERLPQATLDQKLLLAQGIAFTYKNFYPISSHEGDFLLNLGVLLYEIEYFEEALKFFERTKEISGSSPALLKNITLCLARLKQRRFEPESQLPH